MNPIVGSIVIYTLTEQDAVAINNTPHAKNTAHAVRAWGVEDDPLVQLQVFYSVQHGDGQRQWHRPVPA